MISFNDLMVMPISAFEYELYFTGNFYLRCQVNERDKV